MCVAMACEALGHVPKLQLTPSLRLVADLSLGRTLAAQRCFKLMPTPRAFGLA